MDKINLFHEAIDKALHVLGREDVMLKEEQYEALKVIVVDNKDCLVVLPTGFGKSLIYQLLPAVFDSMSSLDPSIPNKDHPSTIIVVSPLNALMRDQVSKLREVIDVAVVRSDDMPGTSGSNFMEDPVDMSSCDLEEAIRRRPQILFAHPEILVDDKRSLSFLKSNNLQENVSSIVIDECHLVVDWEKFRPAYGHLGILANLFPNIPIVAMTATATEDTQAKIIESVGLDCPIIIKANPDRPNIYFACQRRGNRGNDRLAPILDSVADELEKNGLDTPLTLVYGNLDVVSDCFLYLSTKLGDKQYHPLGSKSIAANRLFTQYHAQYPEQERNRIVDGLLSGTSVLRVLFVTVAFGIGIDLSNIRRVIHIGIPYSMEEYFQEVGRSGRDGQPATASMYYNSYDISKGKKGMSDVMRKYAKSTDQCRRDMILSYFGYHSVHIFSPTHLCCDFHKSICQCDDCCVEHIQELESSFSEIAITESPPLSPVPLHVDENKYKMLHDDLTTYRLSLNPGRSCIGSTSLSSGFSMELVDLVCSNFHDLNNLADILEKLPVFSTDNAKAILTILTKYK